MSQPCTSTIRDRIPSTIHPAALLADVRTGTHPDEGYDRVVFDFRDSTAMPGFEAAYVGQIHQDPSGNPLPMLPGAKLRVIMQNAAAHDQRGRPTVPSGDLDLRPGLPRVKQVKVAGDFEAVLTFGIAVSPASARTPFRAFTLGGNRLVLDFAHQGKAPWLCGQVFFADQQKIVAGTRPAVTAVERRLDKPAVAGAALRELFEGPTTGERDGDLLFVASHATGFADLRISNKVAHVRLLGPISSDGSAVITVADQIMPTLRQFPTVDWVKIYDEAGHTQLPNGQVDSIPAQLEP